MNDRYDDVVILADHPILLAVPAFLPAILIAGAVLVIAVRDRRSGEDEPVPPPEADTTPDTDEES